MNYASWQQALIQMTPHFLVKNWVEYVVVGSDPLNACVTYQ